MNEHESKPDKEELKDCGIPTAAYHDGAMGAGAGIGPYKILGILGEGAYGIVYLAEQQRPVKRRVALKVIKPGMDTKQVIARFEAERQALALLDHQNIAHVLNVGATDAGRPYFAMEYVKGVPITEHCDRYKLTIKERLALFLEVCEAIQHAHQKGIIHRDIKPSNILVSFEDKKSIPKVIDFGIAKAMSQPLTDRTLYTERGQLVGTLEYMSPEQAEMTSQDIDTRSDIYSLGVVLYELLTGVLPFESSTLRDGSPDHLRQVIREQNPKTPSARVSHLTQEDVTLIADRRRSDTGALCRRLRGDLDWITLKAMEKDRTHRYSSASELAADIRRHLKDEPVMAGPPSTLYRMQKYLRRHRALATGAAAVLLVLLAGMASTAIFAFKADRQAYSAQMVRDFLIYDLLGSLTPEQLKSPSVGVHSMVDSVLKQVEVRFAHLPLEEALISQTLGELYVKLGDYAAGEKQLDRAYNLRRLHLGEEHPLTLVSESHLGRLYFSLARYEEAESPLEHVYEVREKVPGPEHPDTLESMADLGLLYVYRAVGGRFQKGAQMLDTTYTIASRILTQRNRVTLKAMYGKAFLKSIPGDQPEEALQLSSDGLTIAKEVLEKGDILTLQFQALTALSETSIGNFADALDDANTAKEQAELIFGREHPVTLVATGILGSVYGAQNDFEKAELFLDDAVSRGSKVLPKGDIWLLGFKTTLSLICALHGNYDQAEKKLKEVISEAGESLGADHPATAMYKSQMAHMYAMQEDTDRLWSYAKEELEKLDPTQPEGLSRAVLLNSLAWLRATYPSQRIRGDANQTVLYAEEACKLTNWKSGAFIDTLAAAYAEDQNFPKAVELENLAMSTRPQSDDPLVASSEILAYNLKMLKKGQAIRESILTASARQKIAAVHYEAAEKELLAGLQVVEKYLDPNHPGGPHPETRGCIQALIELYDAWGKPAEATKYRARLDKMPPDIPGGSSDSWK